MPALFALCEPNQQRFRYLQLEVLRCLLNLECEKVSVLLRKRPVKLGFSLKTGILLNRTAGGLGFLQCILRFERFDWFMDTD
jgi:hypothetical protein